MKAKFPHFIYETEETRQLARILSLLIWVTLGTYALVLFTAVYYQDWKLVSVTLAGSVLLSVPYFLIKAGKLRASSFIFMLIVLCTVTFIATVGQGIHDLAIVTLPIIIVFAGLTLGRVLLRLCIGLTLAAVCWLTLGEEMGWFLTKPFDGDGSNWFYLAMVVAILLVSAIAVDLLATNIRVNMVRARQEIIQRKQAEDVLREQEVQYRNLADSGTALIWRAGTDKLCNYFNVPWLKFTGRTLEQEMGNGWAEGVHPDDFERCLNTYISAFDKHEAFEMDYRLRHSSGEYRWIQDLGTPNFKSNGEFMGYIGHCFDITERRQMEDLLRYQSCYDSMTGIYNRNYFEEELARFERGRDYPISILIADVDGLKNINDTMGHPMGDAVLKQAANVLQSVIRTGDVLARIGGDEFGALLPATDADTVEQIVTRIRERLAEHNAVNKELPVGLSLGAATAENNNLAGLFTLADQRMYADKSVHKSRVIPGSVS